MDTLPVATMFMTSSAGVGRSSSRLLSSRTPDTVTFTLAPLTRAREASAALLMVTVAPETMLVPCPMNRPPPADVRLTAPVVLMLTDLPMVRSPALLLTLTVLPPRDTRASPSSRLTLPPLTLIPVPALTVPVPTTLAPDTLMWPVA